MEINDNQASQLCLKLMKAVSVVGVMTLVGCGGNGGSDVVKPPLQSAAVGQQPVNIASLALLNANGSPLNVLSVEKATVRAVIVDAKGNPIKNARVFFTVDNSGVTLANSTSGSILTDSNGVAQVNVSADSTEVTGAYQITAAASVESSKPVESSITFNVRSDDTVVADIIRYSTTEAVNLPLASSGSANSGQIKFTVLSNGQPLRNTPVNVSLQKSPADFTFVTDGNSVDQVLTSNEQGVVSVNLYPGNIPGPVEIKASLVTNPKEFALSKNISVAGGRVSQDGLSISMSKNSISWDTDGNSLNFGVLMVDRNGNAVPDGTVINFTSEGGKVASSCATSSGGCSIEFAVQDKRPDDGRVSVLAVAEGEKAFIDNNGNNAWDKGVDTLSKNIGNTYRDDNENNRLDNNEFVYPIRTNSVGSCAATETVTVYPNIANTCNDDLDGILREQNIVLMSSDDVSITRISASRSGRVRVRVNSLRFPNNPAPSGTTVSSSTEDKTKDNELTCSAKLVAGQATLANLLPVGRPGQNLGTEHEFELTECASGDVLEVTVATPSGKRTTRRFGL